MEKDYIYVAIEVESGKLFTFHGAYKLADFVGVAKNTVYNNAKFGFTEKTYNGYKFGKSTHNPLKYSNRGGNISRF